MVDNLDEKFDECPLNLGHCVYSWEREKCPLYRVVGVTNSQDFQNWPLVYAVEGCLLSGFHALTLTTTVWGLVSMKKVSLVLLSQVHNYIPEEFG